METTALSKKKAAIYMAIPLIVSKALGFIRMEITPRVADGTFDIQKAKEYSLISSGLYLGQTVLTLLVFLLLGYLLTKNKKKALVFTGAGFFGSHVASLFTTLVSSVCDALVNVTSFDTELASTISNVFSIASVVISVFFSYLAFTAFEGINSKFQNQSLSMTVSQARKRFIVSDIIAAVIAWALTYFPSLAVGTLYNGTQEFMYTANAVTVIMAWVRTVLVFATVYLAGYTHSKNHLEAISFYTAAVCVAAPFNDVFSATLSTVSNGIYLALSPVVPAGADISQMTSTELGYNVQSIVFGVSSYVSTAATVIISIVVGFAALKIFFNNSKPARVEAVQTADEQ